ncbi:hypothetical protein ES319_D08G290300v1 [Gossypium barbadense]|uniref:PGG domain-containing protein n=2 Tax=Gossypium TaxID=3633 RepID=A0A5J5QK04_GOSBA|nr:hypothetical protein ES319_D08G290300v1 [Gossypium barbadense]TYG59441.1 hypothetical protein ES288_D08G302600v1 [Gossypium darwinii]
MDEKLFEASRKGETSTLLQLIEEDPLILEDNTHHASLETPLHVSSSHGHADFVRQILKQNPGLAKTANRKGYTPLHLASANGHVETVNELLKIEREIGGHELCRRKDYKGRVALHLAVIKGRERVAGELVMACPESIKEITDKKETILHLAGKNENGCKFVKGLIDGIKAKEMLNLKDEDGNTVLHLAALRKQHEVMNLLLQQPELDVNAVNSNNLKALDILLKGPKQSNDEEIAHMLHLASMPKLENQVLTDPSRPNNAVVDAVVEVDMTMKDSTSKKNNVDSFKWLEEMRRGTTVAAVLIATVTFEVALNPPGGVWQDGGNVDSNVDRPLTGNHIQGKSIAGEVTPKSLTWFLVWDSIGFLASMNIIVMLTIPSKLKANSIRWEYVRLMMWFVIASVHMVFLYGVQLTTPSYIFQRAVIAPFVFFYGVVGLLALRSGWSLVTDWRNLAKEIWNKKKR